MCPGLSRRNFAGEAKISSLIKDGTDHKRERKNKAVTVTDDVNK